MASRTCSAITSPRSAASKRFRLPVFLDCHASLMRTRSRRANPFAQRINFVSRAYRERPCAGCDLPPGAHHTTRKWRAEPVTPQILMAIYDVMRWAPTTANSNPARIVFITSPEARERLKPHLARGNVDSTMAAPATAIIAYDLAFYEMMPKLNFRRVRTRASDSWLEKSPARSRSRELPSAAARCKAAISSWRRGHWGSIAGPCRASIITASIRNSFPAPP